MLLIILPIMLKQLNTWVWTRITNTWQVCFGLFKVMIPALIVVKILEITGIFGPIARAFGPVMELANLPGEAGLAWVTGMLSNMYGGLVVSAGMVESLGLNTAQITTLGCMLLISHSLPVEITVAAKAGVKPWFLIPFRLITGLVFGIILGQFFKLTGLLQTTPVVLWSSPEQGAGLLSWGIGTGRSLLTVFVVVLIILAIMDILARIGVMQLLKKNLRPIFQPMGIGDEASSITVIGLILGLSYGGGIIIQEARKGSIPKRQVLSAVSFMSICHAVIEDTLLVGSLGVSAIAALPGRLVYSWIVMFLILMVLRRLPERIINRLA